MTGPNVIIKSGTMWTLLMDMHPALFQRHFRLTRPQFDELVEVLFRDDTAPKNQRISKERKVLLFLWYMANQNSFRELADKFNISQSRAHDILVELLNRVCGAASEYIKWPNDCERATIAGVFMRLTGKPHVIGAIDGCHIRIQKPQHEHYASYINRKGYFSILLQGICDDTGRFIDVFAGLPGCVHDARMLRMSDFFENRHDLLRGFSLLGDSAYNSHEFQNFIHFPKRDNGRLTEEDRLTNTAISRGRVCIENAFGRLKCRFRRLRDLQNTRLDLCVKLIIAACTLHNFAMGEEECPEHPNGCPRDIDENE